MSTPSGAVTTITAKIEFYGGSSGYNSIKAWGAQLRQSSGPGIYLKTTSSPIANSASLFYGDGSGLTNLPASSIASGTAAITGISGNTFTINEDLAGAPTDNLSIAFNRGNQADAALAWDESSDKFVFNNPVNISNGNLAVAGAIVAGSGANQITTAIRETKIALIFAPKNKENPAIIRRTITSGLTNLERICIRMVLFFFLAGSLWPYSKIRFLASSSESPFIEVFSFSKITSVGQPI